MPCSLVERFSVWETLSATISVGYEGIRLVSNDTSLPDYMALHSARSSSSCTFLPNSNPSGSHKTMYRDNGCIVSLHHLEWRFDGAAYKNKYIIFSFLMVVVKMLGIWTKLNNPKNSLTVWESNPSEDKIFCDHPNRPWGPHILLYNRHPVSFAGVNLQGSDINCPPPSSTKIKERIQVYLLSPSRPSWHVLEQTFYFKYGSSTFLPNVPSNHKRYPVWKPKDDNHLNFLTQSIYCTISLFLCYMKNHAINA